MKSNIIFKACLVLLTISLQANAQYKKIIIRGLVNAKPIDTYGVFKENIVNINDTVFVEVIYNYKTQIDKSEKYPFPGKVFANVDSNYFRANIKNNFFINYLPPRIDEYLINKENNTNEKREVDKLTIFARGINLPQNKIWSFCRMEVSLKDTSAKIWNSNELPLPDSLQLLINPYATIHIWGESNMEYTQRIEYLDVTASVFSIQTSILQTISSTNALTPLNCFSLTPNPSATGLFHIEGEVTNVQVYNSQGNTIAPTVTNYQTLDLSSFPKGMYVVLATVNGTKVSKKLIID